MDMKLKDDNSETRRVDFQKVVDEKGTRNRYLDIPAISQLQDSLIARGWGEPQRLAILATSSQEMGRDGAASKGIGGNGYLGYSSQRMPTSYLSNTPIGRAEQIHFLLDDLLKVHSDNWLDGGKGGPYIRNGKDAYDKFWNAKTAKEATVILNKSNIRPAGGEKEWNARGTVAENMEKHSYQQGGLIYKPFIPNKSKSDIEREATLVDFLNTTPSYPVEPVQVYKPAIESQETVSKPQQSTKQGIIEYADDVPTSNVISTQSFHEETTPSIVKGTLEFKHNGIDVGNMQELIDLMIEEGISFRITSGHRPGAKTSSGRPSHHGSGNALDITPIKGQTWDDLLNQMRRSKRFIAYMNEHGLGILDEREKDTQSKTGATGAHFHIGPDQIAKTQFKYLIEQWKIT